MKQFYFRTAVISVFLIALTHLPLLATKSIATPKKAFSFYLPPANDANLIVTLVKTPGHMDAHITFNGHEGAKGTVKIINAKNELVNQFEIGLVPAPDFSTINLDEYASGSYIFELTTPLGVHTSTLTIN